MECIVGSVAVGALLVTRHVTRTRVLHHAQKSAHEQQVDN